jgi:hypothetical protein
VIVETAILAVAIATMLAFFIACQKNLGVGWYVVATIIAPIGAFAVVAFEPARIHPVERFRGAR